MNKNIFTAIVALIQVGAATATVPQTTGRPVCRSPRLPSGTT